MGNPGDSYKECLPILHDCDSVLPTLGRSDIKSSNKSVNGPWEIWQPTIHPPVDTLTTNNSPTSGYSDNQQFTHQWELWQPTIHPPMGTLTTNNSPTSGNSDNQQFTHQWVLWQPTIHPPVGTVTTNIFPMSESPGSAHSLLILWQLCFFPF